MFCTYRKKMNTQGEHERIPNGSNYYLPTYEDVLHFQKQTAIIKGMKNQNKKVDSNSFTSYEDLHAYKIKIADIKRKEIEIQFNQAYE